MTFCHIFILVTLKHLSSMSFVCFAYFMSFHSNTGLTTSQIWNQVFALPCPSSLCSRSELNLLSLFGQALDLLVTVSYMCYHTSTSALSTSSSSRGLTGLLQGYLILRGASRLDAFSVYPFQTWLPCYAIGMTTGEPAVRPARSSRTKASSFQISYARAG